MLNKKNLTISTVWGKFQVESSEKGICGVRFPSTAGNSSSVIARRPQADEAISVLKAEIATPAEKQRARDDRKSDVSTLLHNYFSGRKVDFLSLPLDLSGYTAAEKKVLRALAKIPYGQFVTYQQLAKASGFPRGARFIGNVMRKNRLPLFYPCHRVVRSDGGLGGYGPGLAWKKRLLALEGKGC